VGVVGREQVQPVEDLADVGLLVLGEGRVRLLLLADGGGVHVGLGRRAEAAEPVGRHHLGVVGQLGRQPVGAVVLVPGELVGVLLAEQVGAAGRPEQQRAAGEDGGLVALEHVGQVGEGVAGREDRPDPHVAHLDDVAVADRGPLEGHVVVGVDVVASATGAGQGQAARHVVVVDVGLEDVGDLHPVGAREVLDPVDVALGVDDEGDLAVVHEIAAVAERAGLDGGDGDGHAGLSLARWGFRGAATRLAHTPGGI